jgi:hypothetical protein
MSILQQIEPQRANDVSRRFRKIIGLTNFFGGLLSLVALDAAAQTGNVNLAWNASTDPTVAGYVVYCGAASGDYTSSVRAGLNLTATFSGLTPGLTYYFAVMDYDANGDESGFSNEVTNNPEDPPVISTQPLTQTGIAGTPVTLAVRATGNPPLIYQWMDGLAAIPGATSSSLSWHSIGDSTAGNYTVIVSNVWGSATSSVAVLTVSGPPLVLTQPACRTVIATTAASFSCAVAGAGPLTIQWYFGTKAIAGATNSTLAWSSVASSNAGSYYLTVANAGGVAASSAATLTVLPSNTIATAAGVYNGLFFQTNADGTPAITDDTAGLLGNCGLTRNGSYSARVYLGGANYSLAGVFDISGDSTVTISRSSTGLSNLVAVMHVDLINGTRQITGAISSVTAGSAWTSPLLADVATNAYPQLIGANFLMSSVLSGVSPTNFGHASGVVFNGVLSLSGVLGGVAAISQTVPISKDGNVPIYIMPHAKSCLLEGWINLTGGVVTGNLAFIRPTTANMPSGFPQIYNAEVQATGSTQNN